VRMAYPGGLLRGGVAPFCFRILTPALARVIPVRLPVAFELINQGALWAAGVIVYRLLRARGLRRETALVGPCVLILSGFTKFVLWYRFGVDPLALLGIVAVAWALAERRFMVAALLATIAALEKEAILLLAPFAYGELRALSRLRNHPFRRVLAATILWSGAIVVSFVLRTSISHTSGRGTVGIIAGMARVRLSHAPRSFCELVLAVPKTFGAIPLLILLARRRSWIIVQKEPYAAVTIGILLLAGIFGATDYERVYFLAVLFVLIIFLPLLEERPLSSAQLAVAVAAHLSLLDVFSRPDFMDFQRWFMAQAQWFDIAEYATKVVLWTVVLKVAGLGRDRQEPRLAP